MKKGKGQGFDYYLSKETIRKYQEKPIELQLEWLYLWNLFRKKYPENIIRLHNRFREGII